MTEDQITVTLTHPIEIDGKTVSSLTLRRPLVKDLIAAERQPGYVGQDAALLAQCAGINFADVGKIDAGDYRRIIGESDLGFFSSDAGPQEPSGDPASTAASGAPSSSSTDQPAGASATS